MRRRRSIVLAAFAAPFLLLQLDLSSCFPTTGSGTGTNTPATGFNLPPTVQLAADRVRGVAPLAVKFSSSNSTDDGLIVDRLWDFGDNQSSRDVSPTHTFAQTGVYKVTLTLTDDRGTRASRTVEISVTEAPVAVISVDRTAADNAPAIFNFDGSLSRDPDGTIKAFQWDFGDGSREVISTVAHTFATAGTYRVRLTVTDNTGVTGFSEQIIEVGIPTPQFTFLSPPASVGNLVTTPSSALWIHGTYTVAPGVPRTIVAGLDGDNDPCEAQADVFTTTTGETQLTLSGHADRVRTAAYSADGQFIITGSDDRTLRLYNATTGSLVQVFTGPTAAVTCIVFMPNGVQFAYGQSDGKVYLRSRTTGAIIREFTGHTQGINAIAASADGARLMTGSDDATAIVWNANTGTQIRQLIGHTFGVTGVAISPLDSSIVLTGSIDQTARLWDVNSGTTLVRFEAVLSGSTLLSGHTNSLTSVHFSPDASRVLTTSEDRTSKIWNVTGGPELITLNGHSDRVVSGAYSADGKFIITGSADGSARIWDSSSGQSLRTLRPCKSTVTSVSFSPDGSRVLTAIGAKNDIQLDGLPPNGSDLNITTPVALQMKDVPTGTYTLWAEIRTDRSKPSRRYADTTVTVVSDFTRSIDTFTPRVPFVNDAASVVTEDTTLRQVMDIGSLSAGDQVIISVLSLPGYASSYSDNNFSLLLLDAEQKLTAWYQKSPRTRGACCIGNNCTVVEPGTCALAGGIFHGLGTVCVANSCATGVSPAESNETLFNGDQKIIVGHNSPNYYLVIDSGDSVNVRVVRGVGVVKRRQIVMLDFRATPGLTIGGRDPENIPAFDAALLGRPTGESAAIRSAIKSKLQALFAAYDVEIITNDEPTPTSPFATVYFGGSASDGGYGIADAIDPRNDTLGGRALVAISLIANDFTFPDAASAGQLLGVIAGHQIGHLLGLRHVDDPSDIMSTGRIGDGVPTTTQVFKSSTLRAAEQSNTPIGIQDAPQLLSETVGP